MFVIAMVTCFIAHPPTLSSSLSFGVVLWELLTGEKPYTGLNMFVVAYGVGHGTLSLPIPASCPTVLRELMTG